MSKAWAYTTFEGDDWVVVFASDRHEATELVHKALGEELPLGEIEVSRLGEIDYLDRPDGYIMDWGNPCDRIPLVRMGWFCTGPDFRCTDCIDCEARAYCQLYNDGGECLKHWGDWCIGCRHWRDNG